MLLFAVVATVAALAAGGVGAWWITNHQPRLRPTAARSHSPSPSSHSSSPSASPSVAVRPSAPSDAVAIAPAVTGNPDAQGVAAFLKTYFGSINSHNYGEYSALFIPELRGSVQHFNAAYLSTTDSGTTLTGLASTGTDSLAATVTFTSRQNPADSPNNAGCDKWDVVLSLDRVGTGYVITSSPAGYQPSVHACS